MRLNTADGYSMIARGVSINLDKRSISGEGGVEGEIPAGTFSANRKQADLDARRVTLEGNARMRIIPGQLRMP